MASIMQEDANAATKYEIPMIEFEGTWTEMFKNKYPEGISGGIMSCARFRIMRMCLCSGDSTGFKLFTSKIRYKKFASLSQWLQIA